MTDEAEPQTDVETEVETEPAPAPEDPQRGWCFCGLNQRRSERDTIVRDCLRIAANRQPRLD